MKGPLLLTTAIVALLSFPGMASAQIFDFTYNGIYGKADVVLTGVPFGGRGGYLAQSASGTYGAFTVTQLDSSFSFPDDQFQVGTGANVVDANGLAFDLSNGDSVNVYNISGTPFELTALTGTHTPTNLAIAIAPEPAPVAAFGFGVMGLMLRRRRHRGCDVSPA